MNIPPPPESLNTAYRFPWVSSVRYQKSLFCRAGKRSHAFASIELSSKAGGLSVVGLSDDCLEWYLQPTPKCQDKQEQKCKD